MDFNNISKEYAAKKVNIDPTAKQKIISQQNEIETNEPSIQEYFSSLPREQYEVFSNDIAETTKRDGVAAGEELGYKYASAIEYAKMFNTSVEDAMNNLEAYNASSWQNPVDSKGALKAIRDYWQLGKNTVTEADIGNRLLDAETRGDTESANSIMEEYKALQNYNETLQDGVPRNIAVEAVKSAMQTIPYTAAVLAPTIIAGMAGVPALGAAASWGITNGSEYLKLREAGVEPELARKVSAGSAAVQSVIEQTVGNIAEAGLTAAGKKAVSNRIVNKVIGRIAAKGVVPNAVKTLAKGGAETAVGAAGEALEEGLQSITSQIGLEIAEACQEEGVTVPDWGTTLKEAGEEMKGAFLGSFVLGPMTKAAGAGAHKLVTLQDAMNIRKAAETTDSKEMFVNAVTELQKSGQTHVFDGKTEEQIKEAAGSIWENAEKAREANIEESVDVSNNAEGNITDETGERVAKGTEFRKADGELATEETTAADGKNYFLVGDTSRSHALEEDGNRYGYVEYTQKDNTVTINQFKMAAGRENIAKEFFRDFAEKHAGENIVWNPKQETNLNLKKELIEENPNGKKAGLNYFKDAQSVAETKSSVNIAKQLREALPRMTREQIGGSVAIVKAVAQAQGITTDELLSQFKDNKIATNEKTAGVIAGENRMQTSGGIVLGAHEFDKAGKAILYVAKNGDMNTFVHEFAHHTESFLTQDQRAQVMKALGHESWNTDTSEQFADGLVDYLRTGKAKNKGLEDIFKTVAKIIGNIIRGFQGQVKLSKELTEVYDSLLKDDGSGLAQAMRAADEAKTKLDRRDIHNFEAAFNEAQNTNAAAQEETETAQESSEETDKTQNVTKKENLTEKPAEDIKAEASTRSEEKEQIEQKAEETIGDVNASTQEKAEAAEDAAGEVYVEGLGETDPLFQLAGLRGVSNLKEDEYKKLVLDNLDAAMDIYEDEEIQKRLKDPATKAETEAKIKSLFKLTGWQQKDGAWIYEFDDSTYKLRDNPKIASLFYAPAAALNALNNSKTGQVKVNEILDAEDLYKFYPDAASVPVNFVREPRVYKGMFDKHGITINLNLIKNSSDLLTTLKGQLQHYIQATEVGAENQNTYTMSVLSKSSRQHFNIDWKNFPEEFKKHINSLNEAERNFDIQAAKVESRSNMNAAERRANPTLFQIIGEKGALELDRVNEVHTLEDNRNLAKEMEIAGKDAKTIRLATGWERGADGKWKYEVADGQIKKLDHHKLLTDTSSKKIMHLSDILNAPEVFKAYPQLENMYVLFSEDVGKDNTAGYYDQKGNYIALELSEYENLDRGIEEEIEEDEDGNIVSNNTTDHTEQLKSTILHELQHAIQEIEGFAKGGDPETATQSAKRISDAFEIVHFFDEIQNKYNENPDFYKTKSVQVLYDIKKEYKDADCESWLPSQTVMNKAFNYWLREYGIEEERKIVKDNHLDEHTPHYSDNGFINYRSLAGEVESRNVETRIGMSAEERLNTLLRDTEDISRDQQIVLFQTISAEAAAEAAGQERAVRDEYENTDQWLKAPNGEDTNLTEKQWVQVRTENFKKWFGDWENDPENASKIVDENGEPMVCYHGTYADFTVFDASKTRANMDIQGNFFSPWELDSQGYGPNILKVFLNIRNPANGGTGYTALHKFQGQNGAGIKAREDLKARGYDGLNNYDEEFITFDPEQSKSATDNNGNFDTENPSILFQTVDLTNEFSNIDSGKVTALDVENYLNSIINDLYDTATDPLKIQITQHNKKHVIKSNVKLSGSKLKKHESALMGIIKIIENAVQEGEPQDVDLSHNIHESTLKHKKDVLNYVNFVSYANINKDNYEIRLTTERMKNQDPNILNLYNVRVKKIDSTVTPEDVSQSSQSKYNNINNAPNVNDVTHLQTASKEEAAALPEYPELTKEDYIREWEDEVYFDELEAKRKAVMNGYRSYINDPAFIGMHIKEGKQEKYIHKSPRNDGEGKWQMSLFDEFGPYSHVTFDDIEEAEKRGYSIPLRPDSVSVIYDNEVRFDKPYYDAIDNNDYEKAAAILKEYAEKIGYNGPIDTEVDDNTDILISPTKRFKNKWFTQEDFNEAGKEYSVMFQTAYHGSGADFEQFDLSHSLEGEGSNSFGYGVYLTSDENIARDYANRQAEEKSLKDFAEAMLSHINDGVSFEDEKAAAIERYQKYVDRLTSGVMPGTQANIVYSQNRLNFARSLNNVDDLKKAIDITNKRNLYTTTIPDGKYFYWDKLTDKDLLDSIKEDLKDKDLTGLNNLISYQEKWADNPNATYTMGSNIYKKLAGILGSEKAASEYLYSKGYIGIDYPAGTIHGNGNDARNYVIFNENDITIDDHIKYQTTQQLYEQAQQFESWEEFKKDAEEYADVFGYDKANDKIPAKADDAWYKKTWEQAQEIGDLNRYSDEYADKVKGESSEEDETLRDKQWYDEITSDDNMLKSFVRELSGALNVNRDAPQDYEEQQLFTKQAKLRDRFYKEIAGDLKVAALEAHKVAPGEDFELSDKVKKGIFTQFKKHKRDYRDLYSDFTGDENWEVPEGYTTNDTIAVRIGVPVEETASFTPKEKQAIIDRLDFEDIKKEIKDGTFVMDDDRITKLMAGYEQDIEKLNKKIDAMKAQEDENALLNVKQTAELEKLYQERLEKQERQAQLNDVREIKIRLVKDINKKVDFKSINYDEGRQIIAIQALWEDRLGKYVNDFINQEGAYIRDAYSLYKTDPAYRSRIQMLAARDSDLGGKGSKALSKVVTLFETKSFDKWTQDDMKYVAEHLPLTNWIKELGLEQLSKDRKGALQLELQSEEVQQLLKDTLPEDLLSLLSQKEVKNWTLEQMEDLTAVVNDLRKAGREKLRVKQEARQQAADSYRLKIEKALRDSGIHINSDDSDKDKDKKRKQIAAFNKKVLGVDNEIKGTLAASAKRQTFLNKLLHGYSDANVRRVARILDNGVEGVNTTLLYYRENECYNNEQRMIRTRSEKINNVLKENDIKLDELFTKVNVKFADGEGNFTYDELLYFAAANEDDNSRMAVSCGNMYDDTIKSQYRGSPELEQKYQDMAMARYNEVLKAADALPEKFKKLAAAIEKDYGAQYERMNKISIDEWNSPVWRVQHYVPLIRLESNGDTNANRVKQDLLGSTAGAGTNWVDKGMTKKRVDISPANQKPVETGLYSTWADSLKRTEHFINYAAYVRELNRVYMNRDSGTIKQLAQNRYGDAIYSYINNYINEVANPDADNAKTDFDRLIHVLRGKTAPAYLSWKMSGIIKQACTSPWPYMAHVSPVEYAAAALDMTRHYKELSDAIKTKSEFMNARRYDPIVDLIEEQKKKATNKVGAALTGFENMGMQGLEWIDWACVAPGWLAVYRKEYSRLASDKEQNKLVDKRRQELKSYEDVEGLDWVEAQAEAARLSEDEIERRAVLKADDITRLCQPSNRLADLAPMYKARGKGSELARTILQFTTSLNVIWQNIRYDLPQYARDGEMKKVVGTLAGYTLAGIAMGLVTEGLGGDDDDDKDALDKARKLVYLGTTQFTDAVPLMGSVLSSVTKQLITGEKSYRQGFSDLFPLVTKTQEGISNASKGDWDKACNNWIYAAGLSLGLPVSGIKEAAAVAGIGNNDGELRFYPQAMIGRREEKQKN